jgi:hypothetical protein
MLELIRRVLLALTIAMGLWLFFLADLTPYYSVRIPNPPSKPGVHGQDSLLPFPRTSQPPEVMAVSGEQGERFMAKAVEVSGGQDADPAWMRRIPPFERKWDRPREIYFKVSEFPLAGLIPRKVGPGNPPRVLEDASGRRLQLRFTRLDDASFSLGSGLSEYGPPLALVFAWRPWAWWCFGAGLATYLMLPWPRFAAGCLHFARWRVCLGDFGWVLMFSVCFGLPLAIVGGSVQALTCYGIFPCVFWVLAGLALVLVWYTAWAASFHVGLEDGGVSMGALGQELGIPFSSVVAASPVRHRYPKWFIRLLWIAALFGRGTARLQVAGQAMLLGASDVSGLALELENGSTAYIWLTDALGSMAIPGGGKLVKALEGAGVPLRHTPKELVRLFPPMMLEAGSRSNGWRVWAWGAAIFLGPTVVVLLAILVRGIAG